MTVAVSVSVSLWLPTEAFLYICIDCGNAI